MSKTIVIKDCGDTELLEITQTITEAVKPVDPLKINLDPLWGTVKHVQIRPAVDHFTLTVNDTETRFEGSEVDETAITPPYPDGKYFITTPVPAQALVTIEDPYAGKKTFVRDHQTTSTLYFSHYLALKAVQVEGTDVAFRLRLNDSVSQLVSEDGKMTTADLLRVEDFTECVIRNANSIPTVMLKKDGITDAIGLERIETAGLVFEKEIPNKELTVTYTYYNYRYKENGQMKFM